MMGIIRKLSAYAVISLLFMLFLLITVGGEKTPKPMRIRTNPEGIPFLHSEAEKWSFQNQIQKSILEYLNRVEKNAKELMKTRYKFGRGVKIPEYFTDLGSMESSNGRLNATIHFVDGWANGFPNIRLLGGIRATYEESTIKFLTDVNFWKHLVFVYEYNILEDCREFKGQIKVDIKDARYSLMFALDIPTKSVELKDFRKKNVGVGDVHVDGLEGNSRLSRILVSVFSGFYRDTVFSDIETAMRTILEDSFKNVSVSELLPEVDYEDSHPKPQVEGGGLETCDTDAESVVEENALPWGSVTEIQFIQNTGEMWAFQNQMDSGLNQLMKDISIRTTEHLAERELLRGKLADEKFLMNIRDQTSTARHAPMILGGGWFSNPFKFGVSRLRQVEFRDGAVDFTASFHLEDPIEFVHNFSAVFLRKDYEGDVKGSAKFVEYALKFTLNLKTAVLTLEDPKLDCVREISVLVTGLESEGEWFSSELKRNLQQRFRDATLPQIHTLLCQAFYYVTSAKTAEEYLPKWNYARNFRSDFELRLGEHDEDSVEICDAERIQKAEERIARFSKLIDEDGVFHDSVPDAGGKYFTHVSGIKEVPIRYTSTRTQSWYFDQELRMKMNEYMYKLLRTTGDMLRIRGLGRAKMPDYEEAANGQHNREMRIRKCWVDGLTSVAVTGIDILQYDQKVITLMTNIQVYKDLKFEGEYLIFGPRGRRTTGKIVTQLPPVELSLAIDIDYLGEKTAKLDYMKLECVGANSSYSSPNARVDRVSDSVDVFFREVMVEHLVQIFRRAFEDAMVETKWEQYLPEWDYQRDYITEIILHKNINRFQITMDFCSSTESDNPSLSEFYPDEETVEFFRFLPEIKMPGLRRSFQRQIHILMTDAVNSMWRNMVKGPLQRFNPPMFLDKGLSLKPKDSNEENPRPSLIYSAIDCQGLTSASDLDEVDFSYGKDGTLIILFQQSWDSIKVTYNLSVADDPNEEREYGTAVAEAQGLQYLLKVRFFLSNSSFSVDEFFLRCLRNFSVTVRGLGPERDWLLDSIKEEIRLSFPESELPEIKELLYILYGYAAAELKTDLYTYSWTYYPELFKVAAQEEARGKAKPVPCREEETLTGGNKTVIARGDIPFIGSEAEWWSFSGHTKGQIDRYKREVRRMAREFLRDHALQEPLIPDLTKNFAKETNQESDTVTCRLTDGSASNLMNVKYAGETVVKVGKNMSITSFVTFDDNLKMRYRVQAKSDKEATGGRVRGVAKSLIYKMVISVNLEDKSANLESFDFECMRDLEITASIVRKNFAWVKEMIPEAFRDDFTSLVTGDIQKMLKMAFMYGLMKADVPPYVEDWNYRKDYGARSKPEDLEKSMRAFSSCRAA